MILGALYFRMGRREQVNRGKLGTAKPHHTVIDTVLLCYLGSLIK